MVFRAIILLLIVGVAIYAFIDCARTRPEEVRGLPRPAWLILILIAPVLGPLLWLFVGRGGPSGGSAPRPAPRTLAPDDDPDFLMSLEIERRRRLREKGTPAPPTDSPADERSDDGQDGERTAG